MCTIKWNWIFILNSWNEWNNEMFVCMKWCEKFLLQLVRTTNILLSTTVYTTYNKWINYTGSSNKECLSAFIFCVSSRIDRQILFNTLNNFTYQLEFYLHYMLVRLRCRRKVEYILYVYISMPAVWMHFVSCFATNQYTHKIDINWCVVVCRNQTYVDIYWPELKRNGYSSAM